MAVATYRLRRIARIDAGYFDLRLRFQAVPEQFNQDGANSACCLIGNPLSASGRICTLALGRCQPRA
jgi:hypothetical protein